MGHLKRTDGSPRFNFCFSSFLCAKVQCIAVLHVDAAVPLEAETSANGAGIFCRRTLKVESIFEDDGIRNNKERSWW